MDSQKFRDLVTTAQDRLAAYYLAEIPAEDAVGVCGDALCACIAIMGRMVDAIDDPHEKYEFSQFLKEVLK